MKNKCPICGNEYTHHKRLLTHMDKGRCGSLAGKMGIKLDLDGRSTKKLKKYETEETETDHETPEEEIMEPVEPENVETVIPEPDPETTPGDVGANGVGEAADSDFQKLVEENPDWYRISRGKPQVRCPEATCDNWLNVEAEPKTCSKCGGQLIWS